MFRFNRVSVWVCGCLTVAGMAYAANVVEWQFDDATQQSLSGTVSLITSVSGKSTNSTLLRSGSTATPVYLTGATGISTVRWKSFLSTGYLQTQTGSYNTSGGLVTDNTSLGRYPAYMGFSGFGSGTYTNGTDAGRTKGDTIYAVIRPSSTNWGSSSTQHSLFGVGYNIGGTTCGGGVALYQQANSLTLQITRGETSSPGHNSAIDFNSDGDNLDVAFVSSTITTPAAGFWNPAKWYFVAASWTTGTQPVLYLRELEELSTTMVGTPTPQSVGSTTGAKDTLTFTNVMTGIEPGNQPFAIGSSWYDAGGGGAPAYGLAGDMAYARIDNVFSSTADMAAVFASLIKPTNVTLFSVQ